MSKNLERGNAMLEMLLGAPLLVMLAVGTIHLTLSYSSEASAYNQWRVAQREVLNRVDAVELGKYLTQAATDAESSGGNQEVGLRVIEVEVQVSTNGQYSHSTVSQRDRGQVEGECSRGEILGEMRHVDILAKRLPAAARESYDVRGQSIGGSRLLPDEQSRIRAYYLRARYQLKGLTSVAALFGVANRSLCTEAMLIPTVRGEN